MSMRKQQKPKPLTYRAWATVNARGRIVRDRVQYTRREAEEWLEFDDAANDRIVRVKVTIVPS